MRITVIGRGKVGGGLAALWREAGHDVDEIGREGGDASAADVLLVAVPAAVIAEALSRVNGIEGKPAIDATNAFGGRNEEFESLAAEVKSIVRGPVAKAFNTNFAALNDRLGEARARPSMVYAADEEARAVTEELIRDAGYEPVSAGGLEAARPLEDFLAVISAVRQAGVGPFVYRFAPPESL
jgi:predicted dinucleotide-binding enzyme